VAAASPAQNFRRQRQVIVKINVTKKKKTLKIKQIK